MRAFIACSLFVAGLSVSYAYAAPADPSPDEIIRKIQRLRDQGVEYILLNGGGTSRENLRRFAREVMPAFKGEPKRQAAE